MRTNYPAELRSAGLELSFILMGQHRFDYDLRLADFSLRRETLHVIVIPVKGGAPAQYSINASSDYEGYFSITIPVGRNEFQIGLQLGLNYEWVQLEAADLIEAQALMTSNESERHTGCVRKSNFSRHD